MKLDTLNAELERLFELDDLKSLTRDLLGLEPEDIGGASAKGSFVKALTERCADQDAIEALCDAVVASRVDVDPVLKELRARGFVRHEEIEAGEQLGDHLIVRKLGEGRHSITYLARHDGVDVRLKVLRHEACVDRRGLQRFLTHNRLIAGVDHAGLPLRIVAGQIGDRWGVFHDFVEGVPLTDRLEQTGPMLLREALYVLRGILEPLVAIHDERLSHGNLRLENVLVTEGTDAVVLLDPGVEHLRGRAPATNGQADHLTGFGSPKTVAPELIRGGVSDSRSDVYAFGAILYELLSGKPVFPAATVVETLLGHLARDPEPLSFVAPRGWVSAPLDDLVMKLLDKDPSNRPPDAMALLEAVDAIGEASMRPPPVTLSDEEFDQRVAALVSNPYDEEAAAVFEAGIEEGADPARVASSFRWVSEQLQPPENPSVRAAKQRMLSRAARIYETSALDLEAAEEINQFLVELDAHDEVAVAALERVRKRLGKHEEVIEMLLERSENAESRTERARAIAEIGRIYSRDLDDKEQALVAYAQAFCEDPDEPTYADEVELHAGGAAQAWEEALSACIAAAQGDELPIESKNRLMVRMGRWYVDKVSRPDLALPCFQAVVSTEPANDAALDGMAAIYRKAQQWPELGMVLTVRADAAATPAIARDLRAEAAEILETKINDINGARALYEGILAEDPGHARASEALVRIYERLGDFDGFAKILEQRADALSGAERHEVLCRLAEVYEDRLDDVQKAEMRFDLVLSEDPSNLDALRGLDRVYSRTGKYQALLDNLERQVQLAATPRQKITLWERMAGIYDEEFLDHEKAAEALETILDTEAAHDGALTDLARHYRALERWGDLVVLYERHLELLTDDERRIAAAVALGEVLSDKLSLPERAIGAYEMALAVDAEHGPSLDAVAKLQATIGDSDRALEAIEALAKKATSPKEKADQYVRAAELLKARGEPDAAIERYKLAVDANPDDKSASAALRAAYLERGDANAAVELIEREIDRTEGQRAKAKLSGEMARLLRDHLNDDLRAAAAAKRAIDDDPTNLEARAVLGDLAYSEDHFVEAAAHYEQVVTHTDALEPATAVRISTAYVRSLAKSGKPDKALEAARDLLKLAPDDLDALETAAEVHFDHGTARRAFELYWDLENRFGGDLPDARRAVTIYRLGESARLSGDLEAAIPPLQKACGLDPGSLLPLQSLVRVYEAKQQYELAVDTMYRQLEHTIGDERVALLIEIGDFAASKLSDPTYAAKSFLSALSERPDDRKILMKLMQLYSEGKDWRRLVKVIRKIATLVESAPQKAKYLHTAAQVAAKEMGDTNQALELIDQVLELDPKHEGALGEALKLRRQVGDMEGLKQLLKEQIKTASEANDNRTMLRTLDELADLYLNHFGRLDQAIAVHEGALEVEPGDSRRAEILADLYARDPSRYLNKAVAAQAKVLQLDPYRPDAYRVLRKIYTDVRRADSAWCVCQALYVLNRAAPDEAMFYKRMRPDGPAAAEDRLTDDDWLTYVMHRDAAPLLTAIFSLIQPCVIAARAKSAESQGYTTSHQIDLSLHPYGVVHSLHYCAEVLGIDAPRLYQNTNDQGGLSFLHAEQPSIVLGMAALRADLPPQAAAFIASRQLTYFRPGMYVRQILPSTTALKAWLFAAIKLITPQFPIAPGLSGPVQEAHAMLQKAIQGPRRDALAQIVAKLLQDGAALDLKKWVNGVDLTADRAGFLMCDDLQIAIELIRASHQDDSSIPIGDRVKVLFPYATSEAYFGVRQRLRLSVA